MHTDDLTLRAGSTGNDNAARVARVRDALTAWRGGLHPVTALRKIEEAVTAAYVHEHTCTDGQNGGGDGECVACGERDCPHGEPLHLHHDGCPACDMDEEPTK